MGAKWPKAKRTRSGVVGEIDGEAVGSKVVGEMFGDVVGSHA